MFSDAVFTYSNENIRGVGADVYQVELQQPRCMNGPCSQCRGRWAGPGQWVAEVECLMGVNNGIAGKSQWQTGHMASFAKWVKEAEHIMNGTNWIMDGNGGHVTRPPSQSELRKLNTLCMLITELQVAMANMSK